MAGSAPPSGPFSVVRGDRERPHSTAGAVLCYRKVGERGWRAGVFAPGGENNTLDGPLAGPARPEFADVLPYRAPAGRRRHT